MTRVLVVDNYDSFTYNLVQYLGELLPPTADIEVVRNDAATVDELLERRPDRVVVCDGTAHVQAGGGTVADAKPEYEFAESEAKARAVLRALELAAEQPEWP